MTVWQSYRDEGLLIYYITISLSATIKYNNYWRFSCKAKTIYSISEAATSSINRQKFRQFICFIEPEPQVAATFDRTRAEPLWSFDFSPGAGYWLRPKFLILNFNHHRISCQQNIGLFSLIKQTCFCLPSVCRFICVCFITHYKVYKFSNNSQTNQSKNVCESSEYCTQDKKTYY
jgi:hypothetical protein